MAGCAEQNVLVQLGSNILRVRLSYATISSFRKDRIKSLDSDGIPSMGGQRALVRFTGDIITNSVR